MRVSAHDPQVQSNLVLSREPFLRKAIESDLEIRDSESPAYSVSIALLLLCSTSQCCAAGVARFVFAIGPALPRLARCLQSSDACFCPIADPYAFLLGHRREQADDFVSEAVGKFDTNDTDAWRIFNSFLLRLRFKGYCVIFVHHAGKNGTQRGRTDAEDNADLVVQLTPPEGHDPGDGLKACVSYTKVRYGGRLQNFACEYVGGSWCMLADSEEKEIVELLNKGTSLKRISGSLGVAVARVRKIKGKAKAKGLLLSPTEINKKKPVKTAKDLELEKSIGEAP